MLFHFAVPFLILLARPLKRNISALWKIAALVLLAHLIDDYWLIAPSLRRASHAAPARACSTWPPGRDRRDLAGGVPLVPQGPAADGRPRPRTSARPQASGRPLRWNTNPRPATPRASPRPRAPRRRDPADPLLPDRPDRLRRRPPGGHGPIMTGYVRQDTAGPAVPTDATILRDPGNEATVHRPGPRSSATPPPTCSGCTRRRTTILDQRAGPRQADRQGLHPDRPGHRDRGQEGPAPPRQAPKTDRPRTTLLREGHAPTGRRPISKE